MVRNILLVGKRYEKDPAIDPEVRRIYSRSGNLLLGDGNQTVHELLKVGIGLPDRVDRYTRILLHSHGGAGSGFHTMDGCLTLEVFRGLTSRYPLVPLCVEVYSCYAGAAARNKFFLSKGSFLICHGPDDETTLISHNNEAIKARGTSLSNVHPLIEFLNDILGRSYQGCRICQSGSEFDFAVRLSRAIEVHPEMLTDTQIALAYFNWLRTMCVLQYRSNGLGRDINYNDILPLSEEQAQEWMKASFYYLILMGSPVLLRLLEQDPEKFIWLFSQRYYTTPLYVAAYRGHLDMTSKLIEMMSSMALIGNGEIGEALLGAACIGHLNIVQYLVENWRDRFARCDYVDAVACAMRKGHLDVAKYLIKEKAGYELDEAYRKALHVAAERGHLDIIKYFAEEKIHGVYYSDWEQVLYSAAKEGRSNIIEYFVEREKEKHFFCPSTWTRALYKAAENGRLRIVEYLIERRAEVRVYSYNCFKEELFYCAIQGGYPDVVERIVKSGINVFAHVGAYGHGDAPLRLAEAKLLESRGKPEHSAYQSIVSILSSAHDLASKAKIAASKGDFQGMRRLVEEGFDIGTKLDGYGHTMLDIVLRYEHVEAVVKMSEFLTEKGISFKEVDWDKALLIAIKRNDMVMIKTLARKGAHVEVYQAAKWGDLELFKYLIEEKHLSAGENALKLAAERGHVDIVRYLAGRGVKVTIWDAAQCGALDIAKLLIDNGQDVNAYLPILVEWRITALYYAAKHSQVELVRYLIDCGADPHLRSVKVRGFISNVEALPLEVATKADIRALLVNKMCSNQAKADALVWAAAGAGCALLYSSLYGAPIFFSIFGAVPVISAVLFVLTAALVCGLTGGVVGYVAENVRCQQTVNSSKGAALGGF